MTHDLTMSAADLDAYFRRIDYHSDQRPTLDTLRAIQSCHTAAIAFENLTPLTRQPVRLDPASLLQKLVHDRRGGYCFEQNLLLRQVLQTLGFQVTGLAARVRWNVPDDVITARGHMLLRVDLDQQPYIVDVGFGGMTPTGPLRLTTEIEQRTPHEPFRVIAADGTYTLQALVDQAWKPVYRFDLQEQQLPDYEVTSWYLSNHPDSHFVTSLIAARPDAGRRYALRNNQFTVHHLDGASERRTLSSVAELRATLEDVFRLTLPDTPALDAAFERILAQSA